MFSLILYVLATGQVVVYNQSFNTADECVKARTVVLEKILKDNPQVKAKDFDNEKFVLVCSKSKTIH